jgi:hypothetical protein
MFTEGLHGESNIAGSLDYSGVPQYQQVEALIKAITAGDTAGGQVAGLNSGPSLKLESLEATLKTLSYQMKQFTLYNQIGKKKAYSTAEEFQQWDNYGNESAYFIGEGELPESHDSQYQRQVAQVKFMGTTRQVTDVAMKTQTQVPNLILQEQKSGMLFLSKGVDHFLYYGNSLVVPKQFNGMYTNHRIQIGGTNEQYRNSNFVVDGRGFTLIEDQVNEAVSAVVNEGFGMVTDIFGPPSVFNSFVTQKYDIRRTTDQEIQRGMYGNKVTTFVTQFGDVAVQNDVFARKSIARYTVGATAGARHPKAAANVIPDGAAPLTAVVDATGKFGDGAYNGDYYYAVASLNEYGEGALIPLNQAGAAIAVAANESVDLNFSIVDGAYAATGYRIYRSELNPATAIGVTPLYPIFDVSVAQRGAGYDGGIAGIVRDRNYEIPNTEYAFVVENNSDQVFALKELSPMMKMDLALTSPTYRFMILYYITNILYAPKKVAVIKNIGARVRP